MSTFNGKMNSKRFTMSLIGYLGTMCAALLKNWLPGIDTSLVITAAGIVTAYTAVQGFRPSLSDAATERVAELKAGNGECPKGEK